MIADGRVVCCVLGRADFERLLGPYEELWRYEALRKVKHVSGSGLASHSSNAWGCSCQSSSVHCVAAPVLWLCCLGCVCVLLLSTAISQWLLLCCSLQVPILFPLSDRQLWQLARALNVEKFAKGETVFRQGEAAAKFYICQKGAFSCFTSELYSNAG